MFLQLRMQRCQLLYNKVRTASFLFSKLFLTIRPICLGVALTAAKPPAFVSSSAGEKQ